MTARERQVNKNSDSAVSQIIEDLFRDHYRTVLRFAVRRLKNHAMAEDVASECFAIAYRRAATAEINLGWLLTTAWNLIGDIYRSSSRERVLLSALMDDARQEASETQAEEDYDRLADAVRELSEIDQEILMMVHWDDLTAVEISAILDIRISAVWKRRSRAEARLRAALDRPAEVIRLASR